jgi:P-type E1-E2 ATPase
MAAVIGISDPIRPESTRIIQSLRDAGIEHVVMMTGDSDRTAKAIAEQAGITEYYSEVLPEDKARYVQAERDKGRKVIMIGDGINDSPALSESDCGVAINSGAAIAREIADITISEDDLHALITLKQLSDGLMDRIHGNYRRIITFNSFLMLMGALGVMPSTKTALLHNASTIAISLKSMPDIL